MGSLPAKEGRGHSRNDVQIVGVLPGFILLFSFGIVLLRSFSYSFFFFFWFVSGLCVCVWAFVFDFVFCFVLFFGGVCEKYCFGFPRDAAFGQSIFPLIKVSEFSGTSL